MKSLPIKKKGLWSTQATVWHCLRLLAARKSATLEDRRAKEDAMSLSLHFVLLWLLIRFFKMVWSWSIWQINKWVLNRIEGKAMAKRSVKSSFEYFASINTALYFNSWIINNILLRVNLLVVKCIENDVGKSFVTLNQKTRYKAIETLHLEMGQLERVSTKVWLIYGLFFLPWKAFLLSVFFFFPFLETQFIFFFFTFLTRQINYRPTVKSNPNPYLSN